MSCSYHLCENKVKFICISCQNHASFCTHHKELHQESYSYHQFKFLEDNFNSSIKKSNYKRLSSNIISSNSEIILNARNKAIQDLKSLKNSKNSLNSEILSKSSANFLQNSKINESRAYSKSLYKPNYIEQDYNNSSQINIEIDEIMQINEVLKIEIDEREKTIQKLKTEKEELIKANQDLNEVFKKLKKEFDDSKMEVYIKISSFDQLKKENEEFSALIRQLYIDLDEKNKIIELNEKYLKNQQNSVQSSTRK